jgi:periplasmic copper chaperone A
MTRRMMIAAAVLSAWLSVPVQAEDAGAGGLKITAPWARATPKGATIGGGYVKITNTGNASDRLVGGSTDIARRVELHEMSTDNGVMKMRPLTEGIEIKPGQVVEFNPGGYHIMFVGLKKPLTQGEHLKATLQFEKAGKVDVDFTVEAIGAQSGGAGAPGMHMKH